jgi:hypothetical protein
MNPPVIPSGVEGSGGPGGTRLEPPDRPDPSTDAPDDIRWRRLYAFVILFLALQVVLYYAFTKAFE